MYLTLNRVCCRAAVRLASLPTSHPLSKPVARAAGRYVKSYRSPLHELLFFTDISPPALEKVAPTRRRPGFTSLFKTSIATSRIQAIEDAGRLHRLHQVRVYSDSSLYKKGVGAAALLFVGNQFKKSLTFHLGSERHHTVYEAELVGLLLGLHLLLSLSRPLPSAALCLDNQAAIRALSNQKPHSGHHILDHIHDLAAKLKLKEGLKARGSPNSFSALVVWTPGHEAIPENERADSLAKEAAQGSSSSRNRLPSPLKCPLPHSASATKQHLFKSVDTVWKSSWVKSSRFAKSKHLLPSPSHKPLSLTASLPRRLSCLLVQALSGHIPLNSYLHRIGKAPPPELPPLRSRTPPQHQTRYTTLPTLHLPTQRSCPKARALVPLPPLSTHKQDHYRTHTQADRQSHPPNSTASPHVTNLCSPLHSPPSSLPYLLVSTYLPFCSNLCRIHSVNPYTAALPTLHLVFA